jgi:Ca2+:H+ antiporter
MTINANQPSPGGPGPLLWRLRAARREIDRDRSRNRRAVLIPAALLLFAAVFAAVHHAEIVALRVGEPFGSIVLAVAVTVIEVALIVSMMLAAKDGGGALARDTVFAAVMLVLNGVVGLCLVFGGARHGEQSFQEQGTSAALSVLGTLAAITLIVPNYTRATPVRFMLPRNCCSSAVVSLCCMGYFCSCRRSGTVIISSPKGNGG